MIPFLFVHNDGNKNNDGIEYSKEFETEQKAFEYLFQRNERQSFCFGCVDKFKDVAINDKYNSFKYSLSVGEYYRLMAY